MSGILYNDSLGKLIVRLSVGVLVLLHGVHKVLHPESLGFIEGLLAIVGMPAEFAYAVYVGEVLAPLMVIFGVFARLGGLLIAVNMVVAIVLAHSGELGSLTAHGGWALETQGLMLFGSLAIFLFGSGRMAIRPD